MEAKQCNLYISGKKYKLTGEILRKIPQEILEKAVDVNTPKEKDKVKELYINRNSESFESILWYHENGELHMPGNICPAVFEKELKFWNIDAQKLSECCYLKYVSFFEDRKLLKSFIDGGKNCFRKETTYVKTYGKWSSIQRSVWAVLDNQTSSVASKVYLAISALAILTSIFVVCASTHPSFQRDLYLQEWKDYYKGDKDKVERLQGFINYEKLMEDINSNRKHVSPCNSKEKNKDGKPRSNKPDTYTELPLPFTGKQNSSNTEGLYWNISDSNFTNSSRASGVPPIGIGGGGFFSFPPNTHARYKYLEYIDACTVVYFALELAVRFIFCSNKLKFFFDFLNIVDIIALTSDFIAFILEFTLPKEKFDDFSPLAVMECIQILRVLRIFRIMKNSVDFKILVYSLRESATNMCMMTFLLSIAVLMFASIEYYCDRKTFRSIPEAMWWAIITMTTVGYGDKYPTNDISRAIGSICAISGVFCLALLIPVLVNNFILFIGFSKIHGKNLEPSPRDAKKCEIEVIVTSDNIEHQNVNPVKE